jgi:hypothetical protein
MFTLTSRMPTRAAVVASAAIALVSLATSTPASAYGEAPVKAVLAACDRTEGCNYSVTKGGNITGCSPHACFDCSPKTGKCISPDAKRGPTGNRPVLGGTAGNATATVQAHSASSNNRHPVKKITGGATIRRHAH